MTYFKPRKLNSHHIIIMPTKAFVSCNTVIYTSIKYTYTSTLTTYLYLGLPNVTFNNILLINFDFYIGSRDCEIHPY